MLNIILSRTRIPMYKFYIWSIVAEFITYLTFDLSVIHVFNIKLSRLIQLLFLTLFVLEFLRNPHKFNAKFSISKYTIIFLFVITLSTFYYMLTSGYSEAAELYHLKNFVSYENALILAYKLPLRELLVYMYLILYYLILPQIFIRSKIHINYFFKVFERVFFWAILLGVSALVFSYFEYQLFSRQFNYGDGRYIGFRFHGIFGEPRDAAVALIFSLAIFNIRAVYFGTLNLHYKHLLFLVFLIVMTKSGSLAIAIILFIPLFFLFSNDKVKLFNLKSILSTFLLVLVFTLYVFNSPRLLLYYDQVILIPEYLESGMILPYHIKNQIVNIYPFWLTYIKLINFDFFTLFFGSGLGVNAIEVYPEGPYEFGTAHSQLTRLIYETGIIGLISWSFMLFYFIRNYRYIITKRQWQALFFYFVLMCSVALSHRSHLIYIYTAIVFSTYNILKNKPISKDAYIKSS